MKDSDLDYF